MNRGVPFVHRDTTINRGAPFAYHDTNGTPGFSLVSEKGGSLVFRARLTCVVSCSLATTMNRGVPFVHRDTTINRGAPFAYHDTNGTPGFSLVSEKGDSLVFRARLTCVVSCSLATTMNRGVPFVHRATTINRGAPFVHRDTTINRGAPFAYRDTNGTPGFSLVSEREGRQPGVRTRLVRLLLSCHHDESWCSICAS